MGEASGRISVKAKPPALPAEAPAPLDNPAVDVEFRGRKRAMTAHTATPDEKGTWWPKLCAMYPDYADYQARTERDIPVVVLTPRAG